MKKTVLLPLLTIIMAASMLIVGCSKDNNTEDVGIHIERRKLDFWAHQKKNSFSYILTKEESLINAIMA